MGLSWLAVDAKTGVVIEDLPDLTVGTVSAVLGAYTTTTATLPIPTAPEAWQRATLPGASVLVLIDDIEDGADPVPLWGGLVGARTRGSGDTVELALSTLEAALDRYYVGDVTYTTTGQNAIVAALVAAYCDLPIRVAYTGAGTTRTRTYADADDKTLLSVLSELMGVTGGPEWSIGWEWQHSPERITPVLTVGSRIGSSPMDGLGPAATFEMPGPVVDVSLTEDFTVGKGAVDVMATSTATANVRPQSPRQVASSERPGFQYRFTPSTSITNVSTLTSHATARLAVMANGSRAMSLSSIVGEGPRLGVDWSIGDTVGYNIGGVDSSGEQTVPAFPGGITGTARAVGWELSLNEPAQVAPVLVVEV